MIIKFDTPDVVSILKRVITGGVTMVNTYRGYGFDTKTNRVLTYKCGRAGKQMDLRSSYRMNGYTVYHQTIGTAAQHVAKELNALKHPEAAKAVPVHGANSTSLMRLVPATEYIMFSKKLQCSQYFRAGTSLADAIALFARRDIFIDLGEVTLLNPTTMKEIKIKPVVTTTYVLD